MSDGGSVNVTVKSAPVLRADGPCLEGTLASLGAGPKPMPEKALNKIKGDALDLLSRVVPPYENRPPHGKVGACGSGAGGCRGVCAGGR